MPYNTDPDVDGDSSGPPHSFDADFDGDLVSVFAPPPSDADLLWWSEPVAGPEGSFQVMSFILSDGNYRVLAIDTCDTSRVYSSVDLLGSPDMHPDSFPGIVIAVGGEHASSLGEMLKSPTKSLSPHESEDCSYRLALYPDFASVTLRPTLEDCHSQWIWSIVDMVKAAIVLSVGAPNP